MTFTSGAPAVVADVMNLLSSAAEANQGRLTAQLNTTLSSIQAAPTINARNISVPTLPTYAVDIGDVGQTFDETARAVLVRLVEGYNAFLAEHFPNLDTYVGAAEAWLNQALQGGSGINVEVEDQLWARERTRTLRDAARATEEAMTTWLSRGFALPPGALVHQAAVIDREAQEKIGEASRERAIKAFDMEMENVRLAVARAIDLRNAAIQATTDYVKNLIASETLGAQMAQTVQAGQIALTQAQLDAIRAGIAAADLDLRANVAAGQLALQGDEAALKAKIDTNAQRVQANLAAAQAYATMAGAALNGLHAQASVSGSDVTQTQIQA